MTRPWPCTGLVTPAIPSSSQPVDEALQRVLGGGGVRYVGYGVESNVVKGSVACCYPAVCYARRSRARLGRNAWTGMLGVVRDGCVVGPPGSKQAQREIPPLCCRACSRRAREGQTGGPVGPEITRPRFQPDDAVGSRRGAGRGPSKAASAGICTRNLAPPCVCRGRFGGGLADARGLFTLSGGNAPRRWVPVVLWPRFPAVT